MSTTLEQDISLFSEKVLGMGFGSMLGLRQKDKESVCEYVLRVQGYIKNNPTLNLDPNYVTIDNV
tara:strand:- start:335 stop:529 length:195 start_codon:yes stop_codon:yes gene_type:complete